jgi:hypothetical protein
MYTFSRKPGSKETYLTKISTDTTSLDTTEDKETITSAELPSYYDQDTLMDGKLLEHNPPLTTDATGKFVGHYISIYVTLKQHDKLAKKVQGKTGDKHFDLNLISVYHPCTKTGSEDV